MNPLPFPSPDSGEGFARVHARLAGWVRRAMLERCGGRADVAEDLCQRTWTGVWQAVSSGRYDPARSALSTFVYAVARNVWRQWAKEEGREKVVSRWEGEAVADPVGEAELIEEVRRALRERPVESGLTAGEAWILQLVGQGVTDRELARQLFCAASTAHERKKAALDKLRAYLAKRLDMTERGTGSGEERRG